MKKNETIPLEALLDDPGFERNCALLLDPETLNPTASPKLARAITSLVVSGAVKRAESKRQQSATGRVNASQPRKDKAHVTAEAIAAMRVEYMLNMQRDHDWPAGRDHGWIAYAAKELKVDRNTIKSRMKAK